MQDFTTDRTLECRSGNIYPLIDRAANIAAAGFAKDIRIIKSYDPSLPFANINEDALVQVMINLLKNAAEALEHRSEEHTSELQSLMRISYAVFCLKKTQKDI